MFTKSKKGKSSGAKKRFIGKPTGQIQDRVQAVGPEHFGIVAVDCAKRRSKWMLCDFYGKVIIEPTNVEHSSGRLRVMTQLVAETCKAEGLTDSIVAVEMTGFYHKPVQRAFRRPDSTRALFIHLPRTIIADRCIPTRRPMTMIWKQSSMRP